MRQIPNALTLANLLTGCAGIVFALQPSGKPEFLLVCLFACLLFDVLDGTMARILKASSPIGAQLDSLADIVSFGVFPSAVLFQLLKSEWWKRLSEQGQFYESAAWNATLLALPAFVFAGFAAWRLARFNAEDDASGDFRGLASPAAACGLIGFAWLLIQGPHDLTQSLGSPFVLMSMLLLLGFLMVSNLKLFSLKSIGTDRKIQIAVGVLALLGIGLLVFAPWAALFGVTLGYLVTGVVLQSITRKAL